MGLLILGDDPRFFYGAREAIVAGKRDCPEVFRTEGITGKVIFPTTPSSFLVNFSLFCLNPGLF